MRSPSRPIPCAWALASLLCGCSGGPSRVSGTDEHGNSVTARVHVVDSTGAPVRGTDVFLNLAGWLDGDSTETVGGIPVAARTTTDTNGFCTLPKMDSATVLLVRAGDGEQAAAAKVRGASDTSLVLVLKRTGSVQGILDNGAKGILVRVPGMLGSALTDAQGRFSLGFLPAGAFRLQIGSGAARQVLDSIAIRPRKTLDLGVVPIVDGDTLPRPAPQGTVLDLPGTPRFQPAGGTFPAGQEIQIAADAGDQIETSTDGITWTPLNGSLRLMSSQCVRARAVHDSRVLSAIATTCYEIQP